MKAIVFNTKVKAEAAQAKILEFIAAKYAEWVDAQGNIVGINAATELPAVRATRTTRWATPAQRLDTGEWWIPAPPRDILAAYKTQLQNAGARLEDVSDTWFAEVTL